MKTSLSLRTKRNLTFALFCVGIICILARLWEVVVEPQVTRNWFKLGGILVLTYCCYDSFMRYCRALKHT